MIPSYIVTVRYGHADEASPRFDRNFGPFRSKEVALDNRDRLRARIDRHLDEQIDNYNERTEGQVYVHVNIDELDNRASRYHYLDLEAALQADGVVA